MRSNAEKMRVGEQTWKAQARASNLPDENALQRVLNRRPVYDSVA